MDIIHVYFPKANDISVISALCILGLLVTVLFVYVFCRNAYIPKKISKIDKMTGKEFEDYLCTYFRLKGYRVSITPVTGDFGADLIIKKHRTKTVVQVKRYENSVGLGAVQEATGAIKYYKAHKGMVVTNSHYTKGAKKLAEANHIELWDRDSLIKKGIVRK